MTRNSSVAVRTPSMSQSVFEQRIVNGLPSSRSIWHARLLGVASANTAVIAENAQSKRFACVAYDVAGNPAASMTRRYVEPISTRCDWRRRQSPTVTSDGLICMFTTFRGDGACRRRVRRSNRRAWRTLRLCISGLHVAYLQVLPADGSGVAYAAFAESAGVRDPIFTVCGFFASGTSLTRSIQRRPFSSVAPSTRTWSAS
jgi:hypothetical protein